MTALDARPRAHDRVAFTSAGTLSQRDLSVVARAVTDIAPSWSVELNQVFAGEANLVLMPEDADDALGPTFIIRREAQEYCLDEFHWDNYRALGTFAHLRDVIAAVRDLIVSAGGSSAIPSVSRH